MGYEPYFAARRLQKMQAKEARLETLMVHMRAAARAYSHETQEMLLDFERMREGLRDRGTRYLPLAQAGRSVLGRRTPSVQAIIDKPRAESVMLKKTDFNDDSLRLDAEESIKLPEV